MNIAITFRQMEATDAVKTYATEKVGRLQKFLRRPMKGQVTLSCKDAGKHHCTEVDIHSGAEHFHAHETTEDMYASIDKVVDKLERQITSAKAQLAANKKGADRASQHLLSDDSGEE